MSPDVIPRYALIMAGGSGTRFWPASRNSLPKQLLPLTGDHSMLQQTVSRLAGLVPADQLLIMTNQMLVSQVREQLPQLSASQVVGEPCKRDTAPCIGLAALLLTSRDPEAVMMVMPSDHVIVPTEAFQRAMEHACQIVERDPRQLVTFGIRPTYPAESFGYIERGAATEAGDFPTFQVAKFHEKPTAAVARQYLESGTYYWNAGIFVWKAATLWAQLEQQQPEMAAHLQAIATAWDQPNSPALFAREFEQIAGRSIDYAVMEHAPCVTVVEAPFDWDDVGSWQAIARLQPHDSQQNVVAGRHIGIDTRGSIIRAADDHLVVTIGMHDCIVVHTPDATLVARQGPGGSRARGRPPPGRIGLERCAVTRTEVGADGGQRTETRDASLVSTLEPFESVSRFPTGDSGLPAHTPSAKGSRRGRMPITFAS